MEPSALHFQDSTGHQKPVSAANPLPVTGGGGGGGDASAANQATQITQLGALTETAPATDTASSGLNGRLQRVAQRLTSLIALLPASLGAKAGSGSFSVVPATDGTFTVTGTVASGATDSGNPQKMGAVYNSTLPTFANGQRGDLQIGTRGSLHTELFPPDSATAFSGGANTADAVSSSSQSLNIRGFGYLFNGTNYDRMRGDANGVAVQPALSANFWGYAAASGGISNTTTAVTIKAAAGASVRNYLKSLQISSDALGTATEIAIRDGAGGTVLWREKIGTAGYVNGRTVNFDPPLKGTANTLLEVVTLTASGTGAVFVNAQGYTGV